MPSEPDPMLVRALDPATPSDELARIVRTPKVAKEVRHAALINPSFPTEILVSWLQLGHPSAWLNPSVPLVLLTKCSEALIEGAKCCADEAFPLAPDDPLRPILAPVVQQWWSTIRKPAALGTTLGKVVEYEGAMGSEPHRRLVALGRRWVEETHPPPRGWDSDSDEHVRLVDRWLAGDASVDIELLVTAANEARALVDIHDPTEGEPVADQEAQQAVMDGYSARACLLEAATFHYLEDEFGTIAMRVQGSWRAHDDIARVTARMLKLARDAFPRCPLLDANLLDHAPSALSSDERRSRR